MSEQYTSYFGQNIAEFVAQKRAVGWPYVSSQQRLAAFDRFCVEYHPHERELTRTLALHWAERRPEEHVNTLIRRITPIRQFAQYLHSLGIPAYIIPSGIPGKSLRYVPHIFTKEELGTFFRAVDQCAYDPHSPTRHWVVPVIFRVLYCCGLRAGEVVHLTVEDVDLTTGVLTIRQSKGHKDRRVPLAPDMWSLCKTYDQQMRVRWSQRTAFFPNHHGGFYGKDFLGYTFHAFWNRANIGPISGNSPRVHDFRYPNLNKIPTFFREASNIKTLMKKGSDFFFAFSLA